MSPETSLGFSAVDFSRDVVGIDPLPWQRWLLIHALELRRDGRFRFRTVLVLVARQNGKTTIVEVKNLWKMFVLRVPLVIGTAQNLDISEESWDRAVEIVESVPDLSAEVAHVDRTNGKKALRLTHGSRWKIATASRRARGLAGDDVNLDELREHRNWLAWGAVTKTTMARANAQIWAFSNAGDDESVVLNDLQEKGRHAAAHPESADSSLGHFEWSAPPDCPVDDPQFWPMANPALGYTITEEALRSALTTDPEPVFRTECLCQHVPVLVPQWSVIGEKAWQDRADAESQITPGSIVAFALDADPDSQIGTIGVCGLRVDGRRHVEVVERHRGTSWMADAVARMAELSERWKPAVVVVLKTAKAAVAIRELEQALRVPVESPTEAEYAQACGAMVEAFTERDNARHLDQPSLNRAVGGARKRENVEGGWRWSRQLSSADIGPAVVATLGLWGFDRAKPLPRSRVY